MSMLMSAGAVLTSLTHSLLHSFQRFTSGNNTYKEQYTLRKLEQGTGVESMPFS